MNKMKKIKKTPAPFSVYCLSQLCYTFFKNNSADIKENVQDLYSYFDGSVFEWSAGF